jgi:hypothetical protein
MTEYQKISAKIKRRLEERAAILVIKEDMARRREADKENKKRMQEGKVFKALSRYNKEHILTLMGEGKNLADIGALYGVSRQRMYQVIQRLKIDKSAYGNKVLKEEAPIKRKRRSALEKQQRLKLSHKRSSSLAKGQLWDISYEDVQWPSYCPVLGIELDYFAEKAHEGSVSFDQLVPGKGYTKENLVIMSWRANRIKNDGTAEEHKKIFEFILKYS